MKTRLGNIYLDILSKSEALNSCLNMVNSTKSNMVFFLNAHCFNIAQKDTEYLNIINRCDLLLNDGIGIEIAAHLFSKKLKDNLNGTDLIPQIINLASKNSKSIYLLGGEGQIPNIAKQNLMKRFPGIQIVGCHNGYFNTDEEEEIIKEINTLKTDILIVGMGVPLQEKWIYKNRDKLKNVKLLIAGGAIIDFTANKFKRAPQFIRRVKLEWVYRLVNEPKRLWKRYILGNFKFFGHVIFLRLKYRDL